MAELKLYLSKELDKRFRMLAMSMYGYGRGSLSKAAVDALTKWCAEQEVAKPDNQSKQGSSPSNSDPVTRAEERPGIVQPGERQDSGSALPLC